MCEGCQKLPRCEKCGLPLVGVREKMEGNEYHPHCYASLSSCTLCSSKISGSHVLYSDGSRVCKECLGLWKPCGICGIPVFGKGIRSRGSAHHERCAREALKCSLCTSLIDGSYYKESKKIFGEERVVCRACFQKVPTCDFCYRKIKGKVHTYVHHLYSCEHCFSQAVRDDKDLPHLLKSSIQWLESFYPPIGLRDVELSLGLIPTQKLSTLLSQKGRKTRLNGVYLCKTKRSQNQVVERLHTILIEEGLPEMSCIGVLIHELVHLWQRLYLGESRDLEEIEGQATWAEYRFLKSNGQTILANRLFYRQDYPYGTGLRRFLELEQRLQSSHEVFESMKRNSALGSRLRENPMGSFTIRV